MTKHLHKSKAPRKNEITNLTPNLSPEIVLTEKAKTASAVMKYQYFPTTWKAASTIMTRKRTNKPPNIPSSYRPISLLAAISKVIKS